MDKKPKPKRTPTQAQHDRVMAVLNKDQVVGAIEPEERQNLAVRVVLALCADGEDPQRLGSQGILKYVAQDQWFNDYLEGRRRSPIHNIRIRLELLADEAGLRGKARNAFLLDNARRELEELHKVYNNGLVILGAMTNYVEELERK